MANAITITSIHKRMEQALKLKDINRLEQQAQEIEKVLRTLKQKRKIDDDNNQSDLVSSAILQEIRTAANRMLKFQGRRGLFNKAHTWSNNFAGTDDIVEAELAAVLAAIQNKATGSTQASYLDFTSGQGSVTVYADEIMEQLPERVGKKAVRKLTSIKEGQNWQARAQKADVKGIATITGDLAPEYERLVQLFSNITFTIKNYSSVSETNSLGLGTTKPAKAIRGALYYLGYRKNFDMAVAALSQEPEHLGHLTFAYELAGWGQGSGQGKNFNMLPAVDFLIYNDPAVPESIAVRSTKKIIYDKIYGTQNMGTQNRILKAYFGMKESNYKRQLSK